MASYCDLENDNGGADEEGRWVPHSDSEEWSTWC